MLSSLRNNVNQTPENLPITKPTILNSSNRFNPYANRFLNTGWNEESIREENEFAETDEVY